MRKFVLIERDVVEEDIYIDFVYETEMGMYYTMVHCDDKTYQQMMTDNKKQSIQNYYYQSMILCAYFDTHGKKQFLKEVKESVSRKAITRIEYDIQNAIINNYDEPQIEDLAC